MTTSSVCRHGPFTSTTAQQSRPFALACLTLGLVIMHACALLVTATPTRAETDVLGYKSKSVEGTFDDVMFDLRNTIVNKGLVIDYVGHLDKMLERTSESAGSTTADGSPSPYKNAKYLHFCSAKLTHGVVSANALNIAVCPYVMFLYELRAKPGTIHVGYRRPIGDPSRRSRQALAAVETLLQGIVDEVTE